jgi:hypothetical protein
LSLIGRPQCTASTDIERSTFARLDVRVKRRARSICPFRIPAGSSSLNSVLTGRCHCGNIALTLTWDGEARSIPARACGCTFCVKHGGVWTSNPRARLSVEIENPALASHYAFGTGTATFHICARCGAVPFVTSEIENRLYAVVNVNVLENLEPSSLVRSAADFEGEDVTSRLARRTRNWIADVRIVEGRRKAS